MTEPDRDAYARKNAVWIGVVFGGVLVIGLIRENTMAVIGGALGLAWLVRAFWRAPR
jgi:hypothetical protein